ncbi:MAG: CehA/McbA family metallohydrolase [Chthoniobacteraceae bacterium]
MSPRHFLLLPFMLAVSASAAPEAFEVGPDRVAELPGGKEADGIVGDFILRNDRVEAVISGNLPLRRANMSTFYGENGITPGCLYDLTMRGTKNDQITVFTPAGQQGRVSYVRVASDGADGEAVIETVVTAANHAGLSKRHEYRLRDGWQGVLITTVLKNESKEVIKAPSADRWTNFKQSGNALGIAWADAIDPSDKAGYAYGSVDPVLPTNPVLVQPGQEVKFSRFVAVGTSPVEAFGVVAGQRGPVGTVTGTIREPAGKPVRSAQILVRSAGEFARSLGIGHTNAEGQFTFAVPAGAYTLSVLDQGRPDVERQITVEAGQTQTVPVEMAAASVVRFQITDEAGASIPCKVQFHATGDTPWPYLGPENRAHGCVDQYHSEKGAFDVQLAPGTYRAIVTRGIEYSHLSQEITVPPGEPVTVAGQLKRLVDTRGWISADYHNHSTPSGDNTCGTNDRLINLAAEHIEFAPTTEHNRLYDWAPHIEQLGLKDFIQTVPGMELTGSGPHFNAFPFKPVPFTQDNGAPVWNRDPRITAVTLRDWQGAEPDRWVQINHPDMVENFIDRDGDGKVDGGYQGLATLIDGIETQNFSASQILSGAPLRVGKNKEGKESISYHREFIWLQMLNRGHRYAAMAVCDAHSVWGNGVGGWRMYMPSSTDEPAKIDWRENSRHARAGRSFLTTGPFLQVRAEGQAGPGEEVRANGRVALEVKVQCTDWIDIDRVQVLVNGRAHKELNFTRASHADWFADGVVKFQRTIKVPLTEDAHIIVVATGEGHTLATGYGTSSQAKIRPIAYHNPIFVDVDGGGFRPNGDTLDWPLPVKKIGVAAAKKMLSARSAAE